MDLSTIKKPAFLLDETKCRRNIRMMAAKAGAAKTIFRPHFKTHQSLTIGEWFREEGVNSITVSSVTMAKHFASAGWKDITIAFPLNIRELAEVEELAENIDLNILISSLSKAQELDHAIKFKMNYFIKIDTGYGRSGVGWNDQDQILRIVNKMNKCGYVRLKGFLTHSGHTYKTSSVSEIAEIFNDTLTKFNFIRSLFPSGGLIFSTGDTPSCSIVNDFKGFDEIRPGNFVFFDLMQFLLGSCKFEQIAVAVACPVVEKNVNRKEIIIYGGGVHLSKENLKTADGQIIYGKAVLLNDNGWDSISESDYVRSLSQEHGIISSSDKLFRSVDIGDIVGIIPVHSCMTADLLRQYCTFDNRYIADLSPK